MQSDFFKVRAPGSKQQGRKHIQLRQSNSPSRCFRGTRVNMSTYRPSSQIGDSNGPDSESILDASVSFGRRTTTRLPRDESVSSSIYAREQVDFLALISAIADLYTQDNVLEMQCRGEGGRSGGMAVSRGAVGEVSAVYAAFNNRPMAATAQPGRRRRYIVVLKRAADKMFKPNGDHNDADVARSFIAEIRILSHRSLRQHANIVTLLGVHWDHIDTVSVFTGVVVVHETHCSDV